MAKRLPRKLSLLLTAAIEDAQKIERDSRYRLDMSVYHLPTGEGDSGKCNVCMAGALMACRLDLKPSEASIPENFDHLTQQKLFAVDMMRKGHFAAAAQAVGVPISGAKKMEAIVDAEAAVDYLSVSYGSPGTARGRAPWRRYELAIRLLSRAGL